MRLIEAQFGHFRSFGKKIRNLVFNDDITYFVGKNHTGKSNIMKLLAELKIRNLPVNDKFGLNRDNWYNNESGIDKPLKITFTFKLNDEEFAIFIKNWILDPLHVGLKDRGMHEDFGPISGLIKNEDLLNAFAPHFGEYSARMQMEFIDYGGGKQLINYNIKFNSLICVNTGKGNQFIRIIHKRNESDGELPPVRNRISWSNHLATTYLDTLKDLKRNSDRGVDSGQDRADTPDVMQTLSNFSKRILSGKGDYIIEASRYLDPLMEKILNNIMVFKGRESAEILSELRENSETTRLESGDLDFKALIKEIELNFPFDEEMRENYMKRMMGLIIFRDMERIMEGDNELWEKHAELLEYFEEIYDSLDITYCIEKTAENKYIIAYYKRTTNVPIQNFDSIGTGITHMLFFLYNLIVERDKIIFIDNPEIGLHPHNQRFLSNLLHEFSANNQLIIATNSPFFFQADDIFRLRLFDLKDGITTIRSLEIPGNSRDFIVLKKNFDVRNRDAIFADGIVFVEGPTEEMAFPLFFKNFGLDLDLNNISLINMHGKGNFSAFWKFAHQFHKKYWFFFDYDFLGVKAGVEITPRQFKRSILFKNRYLLGDEIINLCENLISTESSLEFQANLEYLRNILQKYNIFILSGDFEEIFEEHLRNYIQFKGSKVDKAIQLVDFIREHEDRQYIPDKFYNFIELIEEDLKQT